MLDAQTSQEKLSSQPANLPGLVFLLTPELWSASIFQLHLKQKKPFKNWMNNVHINYRIHLLSCNNLTQFTWIRICTLLNLCNVTMWATIIIISKVECHWTFNFGCKQANRQVMTNSQKLLINLLSISLRKTWKVNNLMVDELWVKEHCDFHFLHSEEQKSQKKSKF